MPNVPRIRFDIITLFPDLFSGYVSQSLLAKAIERNHVEVATHNLRDWTTNKHNKVDSPPYGGGPGMLIQVEPVVRCVEAIQAMEVESGPGQLFVMTPQGERLNQNLVSDLAKNQRMILLCGRYEGFDQRVFDILQPRELSIGDFILNGGEVAAMAVIDTTIRLIPGVLGDERSSEQDSFSEGALLEFPQYTKPREFRGHNVPEVLLGGNHPEIAKWREEQSRQRTQERRSDLLD